MSPLVAKRLREALIDEQRLTVTELAPMLDITRPSMSKVLNGRAELSVDLAIRIETVFGLNAEALLTEQLQEHLNAGWSRKRRADRRAAKQRRT